MAKKIIGVLFWIAGVALLVCGIANGSLSEDFGTVAATYGAFIGTMLPILLYIFSGIFLFRFDDVCKKSYVDGFRARKKQCTGIVIYIVLYTVVLLIVTTGNALTGSYDDNFVLDYILKGIPVFIPLLVFGGMLSLYAFPYWNCRKNASHDDALIERFISENEVFYAYSKDNSVLASNKVLFFPKLFCVIPFNWIASIKLVKNPVEQDVVFTLTNGKKIMVVSKEYNSIEAAINANRQMNNC